MYSIINRLMLIIFEQICVKLIFFFYFAVIGVKTKAMFGLGGKPAFCVWRFPLFFFLHAFEGLVATVHALCMNSSHKV